MLERSQQLSVVNKGESLNITCSVSGGEEHSISWFKNKEPVSVNLVFSSAFRSVLMLNNISKSDAGDYECRIMDFGDGYWQKTTTVMVKGKCLPSSEVLPPSLPRHPTLLLCFHPPFPISTFSSFLNEVTYKLPFCLNLLPLPR